MRTLITITFISFISFCLTGQQLKLQQGNREKTFSSASVYKMHINNTSKSGDSCCSKIKLQGKITSVSRDSLSMKLNLYSHSDINKITDAHINYKLSSRDGFDFNIAHRDINYFRHYKSSESLKRKGNLAGIGGILIIMSLGTLTSPFLIDNKQDRELVWKLGGAEFALGLTFAILSRSKRYHINDGNVDNWTIVP